MCDHCGCREFAPIAELTAEHETILDLAWSIAAACHDGRPVPSVEVETMAALLVAHANKEETGLYPELSALGCLEPAQLAELEREHVDLHADLLANRFDRRAYFELAAHIEVEETELFSAARFGFDEPEWDAVSLAHAAVDSG